MKTVMVFGTFDILHAGHISLLKQAKKMGEKLVVVVARDTTATSVKGSAPLHNEKERMAMLRELRVVDAIQLGDKVDRYKVIKAVRPDVIALGYDQTAFVSGLREKIKEFGLKTKVRRLKPFHPDRNKSTLLRAHLLRQL